MREDCETKACEVQVERLRKRRLTQAAVCRKTAKKKAEEERMLLKNPWVRKLREANAAKRNRMQEDCENRDV